MKKFGYLVAGLVATAAMQANALPIIWTDWTSGSDNTVSSDIAHGVMNIDGNIVNVTFTGDIAFLQSSGGTNYWTAPSGTSPYTSTAVDNAPGTSDIIATSQAGVRQTITFSQAVENPVMAIVSTGQPGYPVTYAFDQDFEILSQGRGYWGGTTASFVHPVGTNNLTGSEAHGTIQFSGAVTSISWTANPAEYWHGFTIGTSGLANPAVPEPSTLVLSFLGLAGMAVVARRRKKV